MIKNGSWIAPSLEVNSIVSQVIEEIWMCGASGRAHLVRYRYASGKFYSHCGQWLTRDATNEPHCKKCETTKAMSLP